MCFCAKKNVPVFYHNHNQLIKCNNYSTIISAKCWYDQNLPCIYLAILSQEDTREFEVAAHARLHVLALVNSDLQSEPRRRLNVRCAA